MAVTMARGVQLCEIAMALVLFVLGIAVLVFVHTAEDAAKDYENQQVQTYGSGYVESAPPVLPVAQCQRNATGCCNIQNTWESDYVFCDSGCTAVMGDKLANLCVSDVAYFTSAVDKVDDIIGWAIFTSIAVLVLAVVAANAAGGVSKPRSCCLCCVHITSLVPMAIALVVAGGLVALLESASDTERQQCLYVCKDVHGVPLPKTPSNAGKCAIHLILEGVHCSQGGCCFQSDIDSLTTLAASTHAPFYAAIAATILAASMGCCSLHTCACAQSDGGGGYPAGAAIREGINAPLVPAETASLAGSTTLNPR